MTLKLLVKEINEEIRRLGTPTFLIWKRGKRWYYKSTFYDENLCPPLDLVKEYRTLIDFISRFDENYIVLSTERYFDKYNSLKDMEKYIKKIIKKGEK